MVHKLRRHLSLDAKRLSRRMGRVGVESRQASVFQGRHSAAARDAERTECRDVFNMRAFLIGHPGVLFKCVATIGVKARPDTTPSSPSHAICRWWASFPAFFG